MEKIEFKKGIYQMNSQENFNFQLNRVVMWDGGDLKETMQAGSKITDSNSWKKELISLGDKALSENRIKEAIAYYRMSEFFMYDGDPDKEKYYNLATDMFYDYYKEYFEKGIVEQYQVPYEEIQLPVLHAKPSGAVKDTILLHGGNDSYFEELFFPMLYFMEQGFEVYLFEGPGQGGVLRRHKKHFTYKWEKPVKAILDYFNLDGVTIIGASLGGMLGPRAAAYEKRIKKIIAWSIFPNFLDVVFGIKETGEAGMLRFLVEIKARFLINTIAKLKLKSSRCDEVFKWGLLHGMHAYEAKSPYEYIKKLDKFQMMDVAHLIDQDILILGANEDHFIDYHMAGDEINALTNARSITFRLFTDKEEASNHCNVGNTKLVLDTMINWMNG